jgi:hypothetical protein
LNRRTHHTGSPNLQSPTQDPVRQSPPSLTPDLESCHTRYGFFFLSIFFF